MTVKDIIEGVLPDLERDDFYPQYSKIEENQPCWEIAQKRAREAKSPDNFLKAEITYLDMKRKTELVYLIGHGQCDYFPEGSKSTIYYMDKWFERPDDRQVLTLEISRIEKFNYFGKMDLEL